MLFLAFFCTQLPFALSGFIRANAFLNEEENGRQLKERKKRNRMLSFFINHLPLEFAKYFL